MVGHMLPHQKKRQFLKIHKSIIGKRGYMSNCGRILSSPPEAATSFRLPSLIPPIKRILCSAHQAGWHHTSLSPPFHARLRPPGHPLDQLHHFHAHAHWLRVYRV